MTRYLKNGIIEYHSQTLHVSSDSLLQFVFLNIFWLLKHTKDTVQGYLYKMAKEVKFFSFSLYYRRYFILDNNEKCLKIQEGEIAKKFLSVPFSELLYVDSV